MNKKVPVHGFLGILLTKVVEPTNNLRNANLGNR